MSPLEFSDLVTIVLPQDSYLLVDTRLSDADMAVKRLNGL